jgi:hypothetical protein
MNKILFITDSHGGPIQKALILYKKYNYIDTISSKPNIAGEFNFLCKATFNQNEIEILALNGRTAYNFFNHLELLNENHYKDYKTIFFLGFNDLNVLEIKNNHKESAERYVSAIKKMFDKNKILIVLPLIDLRYSIDSYNKYIFFIKENCKKMLIDYVDANKIISEIKETDFDSDMVHLKPEKYIPILDYCIKFN